MTYIPVEVFIECVQTSGIKDRYEYYELHRRGIVPTDLMPKSPAVAYVNTYQKARYQRPEVKAYRKAYQKRPEAKARMKAWRASPEYKANQQRPEVIARRKAYEQSPKRKAYQKSYMKTYHQRNKKT
ncbi:uncharacterized protein METZ01_LOCUS359775 [marine metagenome]|uniref:Uncharacterized protein n=1 Tax=marine metagenome TaxID=408172 RepID=A0A382SDE1_9ZZZZ